MALPKTKNPVVYLCTEYAIDNDLPTYSGGLGVLAGDVMSEAADRNFPFIGIGILYKGRKFIQHITGKRREEKRDTEFDHDTSFLRQTLKDGKPLTFTLKFGNEKVVVKSYHIRLADKTMLYFLSTDVDGNPPEWISDMDALYRGDTNSQIRQQILLGVGGVRLLNTINIKPEIYHINEGRPGFLIWELAANLMQDEKLSFKKAWQKAKNRIVYTNHTLVAAGNLEYDASSVENWAKHFATNLGVNTNLLIEDGLTKSNTFSITKFAINISSKQSSVSKTHAEHARKEWPNINWVPITNGIHMKRWQDSDFRDTSKRDRQLWDLHITKKRELVGTVLKRTGFEYDPSKLVVSWARRLAEYKQPRMIFKDIERLKQILQNPEKPVQLLFAGNSHSADPNAKSIIEEIIDIFASQLSSSAIFIPNYNISLANHLVSGSDVWLNTPKGNQEACGTSGMKAAANGVLNCTVLDGWTYEANWDGAGWVLDPKRISDSFYNILEKQIAPLYYQRGENGLPNQWIDMMRRSIELSENFSSEKMFEEYINKLYTP